MENDETKALEQAVAAHEQWVKIEDQAEVVRKVRAAAFRAASRAGVTQAAIAEATGITQPAVQSILARAAREVGQPDESD